VTVLVIDDSSVMRRIHRNMLLEHGVAEANIVEAADGEEALSIARTRHITLFLVDWNMPKLDGVQFVKSIRALSTYATTPVIMITSEAAKYNVMDAISAGVTNYVVKPIKGDVLWKKIAAHLQVGAGA
jgi:two-component system, chemotaxis family, chemotaxis protein CheY